MTPCLVQLTENTTFLVTDRLWINVDEIVAISLYDGDNNDEVHIKVTTQDDDVAYVWEDEEAVELRQFLQSKMQDDSWSG